MPLCNAKQQETPQVVHPYLADRGVSRLCFMHPGRAFKAMITPRPIEIKRLPKGKNKALRKKLESPSSSPSMAGRLYPSGAFSIGFVPRQKASPKDLTYQRECDTWDLNETTFYDVPGGRKVRNWCKSRDLPRLVDTHYLGKTRRSRGSRGLTTHGKRYVREACFLLERKYGVKRLGFYTLTIPNCTVVDLYETAICWTEIQKYFFKLLRNKLYASGIKEFDYVGVTENQTKRSVAQAAPCFHLHFIMPCYHPGSTRFLVSSNTIRRLWKQALTNYVPSLRGLNFQASADTAVLRKSASGYISKYFSKGSDVLSIDDAALPNSWYYSSRELKAAYKRSLVRISTEKCRTIIDLITDSSFVLVWGFVCTPDIFSGKDCIRGYYGKLTPLGLELITMV